MDMKFSGLISDINIDNPAKFHEVKISKSCICENRNSQNDFPQLD